MTARHAIYPPARDLPGPGDVGSPDWDTCQPRCWCGSDLIDWCETESEALWVCEGCRETHGLGCGECEPCTELFAEGRRMYEGLRRQAAGLARERREPYAVAIVDGRPRVVPVYAVSAPVGERMDADCWDQRKRRDRFAAAVGEVES